MSEQHNDGTARKRRRRRRGGKRRADPPALALPAVATAASEEEDTAQLEPGRIKGEMIASVVPARYMEILRWYAAARGQSLDQCVASIIRGHLTQLKPSYREATSGTIGKTARKGAEFDRLTNRLRPDGV